MAPVNPANGRGTHEIRVGLWAGEEEARRVSDRIAELLCPDPDHDGPCETPWSMALYDPEALDRGEDRYDELVEQAKIEGTY